MCGKLGLKSRKGEAYGSHRVRIRRGSVLKAASGP